MAICIYFYGYLIIKYSVSMKLAVHLCPQGLRMCSVDPNEMLWDDNAMY